MLHGREAATVSMTPGIRRTAGRTAEAFSWGIFLLAVALFCSENAGAAGWRTDVAHSTVLDGNPVITEASYLDKGFLDTFKMSVGCRNSWPLPTFSFRLPAMTTDIMNPDAPAEVTFAFKIRDLDRDPKTGNYRGGYRLPGLVRHGDYVFLPTGYNGISDVILTLLADLDTTDRKSVIIRFNQGSREWTYHLPLQGYRQAYQAALASCRDVRPRDEDRNYPPPAMPADPADTAAAPGEPPVPASGTAAAGDNDSASSPGDNDSASENLPPEEPGAAPPVSENSGQPVSGVVLAGDDTSGEEAEKALLEEAAKAEAGQKAGKKAGQKSGQKPEGKTRMMNVSAGN